MATFKIMSGNPLLRPSTHPKAVFFLKDQWPCLPKHREVTTWPWPEGQPKPHHHPVAEEAPQGGEDSPHSVLTVGHSPPDTQHLSRAFRLMFCPAPNRHTSRQSLLVHRSLKVPIE